MVPMVPTHLGKAAQYPALGSLALLYMGFYHTATQSHNDLQGLCSSLNKVSKDGEDIVHMAYGPMQYGYDAWRGPQELRAPVSFQALFRGTLTPSS